MADVNKLVPHILKWEELPEVNSERWLSLVNLEGEVWKNVVGYEDCYEISNYGRLRRKKSRKILKYKKHRDGYYMVNISANSIRKTLQVHRVVANAFVTNNANLPCVNHINENKNDNRSINLEWCTIAYNNSYGSRVGRVYVGIKQICLKTGNVLNIFPSMSEAAVFIGSTASVISNVVNKKKSRIFKGYIWERI